MIRSSRAMKGSTMSGDKKIQDFETYLNDEDLMKEVESIVREQVKKDMIEERLKQERSSLAWKNSIRCRILKEIKRGFKWVGEVFNSIHHYCTNLSSDTLFNAMATIAIGAMIVLLFMIAIHDPSMTIKVTYLDGKTEIFEDVRYVTSTTENKFDIQYAGGGEFPLKNVKGWKCVDDMETTK